MVPAPEVKRQLKRIGAEYRFWGVPEIRELPKILFDNEQIEHLVNGRYKGGFATLCATNIRVLLIDKKFLFLTLEDIRYDMVSDVLFNHRLLNASLTLGTVHEPVTFVGFNKTKLREMTGYIQHRVMEYREHKAMQRPPDDLVPEPTFQAQSPQQPYNATAVLLEEPTHQPASIGSIAISSAAFSATTSLPLNPYRMPFTVRRRTARFY